MNIYIEDTGYVKRDFGISDTRFPTFTGGATVEQKYAGEFRTKSSALLLKVTAINFGESNNMQKIPSLKGLSSNGFMISTSPFQFTLTGFLSKPKQYNNTAILKDLADYYDLILMTLSKGHKDLYIKDDVSAVEPLFSLYYLISAFGKTDSGNTLSKKHINISIDAISFNEGVETLSYNLSCTLYPTFS